MGIQNSKEVLWLIQSFPGISEEGMLENWQFFIAATKWLSPENNAGHYLREGGWLMITSLMLPIMNDRLNDNNVVAVAEDYDVLV